MWGLGTPAPLQQDPQPWAGSRMGTGKMRLGSQALIQRVGAGGTGGGGSTKGSSSLKAIAGARPAAQTAPVLLAPIPGWPWGPPPGITVTLGGMDPPRAGQDGPRHSSCGVWGCGNGRVPGSVCRDGAWPWGRSHRATLGDLGTRLPNLILVPSAVPGVHLHAGAGRSQAAVAIPHCHTLYTTIVSLCSPQAEPAAAHGPLGTHSPPG